MSSSEAALVDFSELIRRHTVVAAAPLVPEVRLHLITEACPLWHGSEEEARRAGLVEPYWAFAWPGGQALARHVLDHPELVRGKRVLDFGSGCAIEGIAAAMAGAAQVIAADIDPMAGQAAALNAALNGVHVDTSAHDYVGESICDSRGGGGDVPAPGRRTNRTKGLENEPSSRRPGGTFVRNVRWPPAPPRRPSPRPSARALELLGSAGDSGSRREPGARPVDVVLAGDVFYDRALAGRALDWLRGLDALVLIGDPSRGFLDTASLKSLAVYAAGPDGDLSGLTARETGVFTL